MLDKMEKEAFVKEHNSNLLRYYSTLESRVGYRFVLGGRRHFGFYENSKCWPLPITPALERMEDRLYDSLGLSPGDNLEVLDAGSGYGKVAVHLAKRGLRIQGVDITDRHVARSRSLVAAAGLSDMVSIHHGDYTNLDMFPENRFSGVYTMETLVHCAEPAKALAEFFRVLKPGGSVVHHEFEHAPSETISKEDRVRLKKIHSLMASPGYEIFEFGTIEQMLSDAGFVDVERREIFENIAPMAWLFFVLTYVPYLLIKAFGLEKYFVNAMFGVEGYRLAVKGIHKYVVLTAKKPLNPRQRQQVAA